jgi:hypothetical protein
VTDATPLEFVGAVTADRETPAQPVPRVKRTVSPITAAPVASVTVVDAVAVVAPSAGTVGGLNVIGATRNGPLAGAGLIVWSTTAEPLPPVLDSVAVIVQNPDVVEEM